MERKKILIVDYEPTNLISLGNRLQKAGYTVVKATNGNDAVSLARNERPDLIICEVSMPDMDGGDVLSALQESPITKHTPFIFHTALVKKEEEKKRNEIMGKRVIAKPCDPVELLEEVAWHIGK
ncbi:MAG: response regulator [Deltaproteobacteria bacterium]